PSSPGTARREPRLPCARRPRGARGFSRQSGIEASLSPSLITYRGAVYPSQCDHMGHMNVASYVAKFDEATWQLFAALGLTPSRLRTENVGMAGVEQHIEYKRELFAGDVVTITSSLLEVKERVIRFVHEMKNDE